jgi:hypothetical protein
MTTEPTDINFAELSDADLGRAYMMARERKEKAEAAASRADSVCQEIKQAMLSRMSERGSTGFKVEGVCTVTRVSRQSVGCGDWSAFLPWLIDRAVEARKSGGSGADALAFLQKRVTKQTVMDYMDAKDGQTPPGVTVVTEFDVRVQRAA